MSTPSSRGYPVVITKLTSGYAICAHRHVQTFVTPGWFVGIVIRGEFRSARFSARLGCVATELKVCAAICSFLCALGVCGLLGPLSARGLVGCGVCWVRGAGAALVALRSRWAPTMSWFPNNVACNSHVNLSNIEIGSLELQRF